MEYKYDEIISFLKKYQEETNVKGYVFGVSGGKDSTIVGRILVDAIGKENILGVLMPNGEQHDISFSHEVVEILGIDSVTINIKNVYYSLINGIESKYDSIYSPGPNYMMTDQGKKFNISDKAKTNIAPRLRMTTLYTIAQTLGYRVAGTGNASEIFVGWFTKWGDGASDINPIAHLTCTEVIALGDYLGLPEHLVHKTPADGLTGKSDEENFGFTYDQLDTYIITDRKLPNYDGPILAEHITDKKIKELHKNACHKCAPIIIKDNE